MSSGQKPPATPAVQQQRRGTRQESTESRAKRGANATHAQSRAAIYGNPLPLYVSQNESLALLYSLTWTLSLSCQAIAASLKSTEHSRNRIRKFAHGPLQAAAQTFTKVDIKVSICRKPGVRMNTSQRMVDPYLCITGTNLSMNSRSQTLLAHPCKAGVAVQCIRLSIGSRHPSAFLPHFFPSHRTSLLSIYGHIRFRIWLASVVFSRHFGSFHSASWVGDYLLSLRTSASILILS